MCYDEHNGGLEIINTSQKNWVITIMPSVLLQNYVQQKEQLSISGIILVVEEIC